jgi:predicted ATP-binding protein involved in virulence
MKVKNIVIDSVGGIDNISLQFHEQMNIICGPNGIGKTTILECIAHMFLTGHTGILKRNVKSDNSTINITVLVDNIERESEVKFAGFSPEIANQINSNLSPFSKKLLSLKITRTFQYQSLPSVTKDTKKENHNLYDETRGGIIIHDVKNWFVNRYLYSAHVDALSREQLVNFQLAKSAFSILNKNFEFSRVDASTNEILINTPSGEIYYEYLSSGFKSILSIVFGIIKEIEYRFIEPRIEAKNFDGVILIDELELHLHPDWQERISEILIKVFPLAQFITTTHSPHVIQFAEPNQVIALGFNDGKVLKRELINDEFGFQGWTIEEVLTDVMDMQDTRTTIFKKTMSDFEAAIENEDYSLAKTTFDIIDIMLHPQNPLKKLLKFQLASIYSISND